MQKSLACFFALFFGCMAVSAQTPVLVKDINNGIVSSKPRNMATVGNTVFFSADDGLHGRELWKTTGTEESTVMIADIHPTGSSYPSNFCNVNGVVFFTATTPGLGIELWKTDGTAAGTVLVKDLVEGLSSSEPTRLTAFGGKLFFNALRIIHNQIGVIVESKLFSSDGTAAGTGVFESANNPLIDPANFTIVGNNLFFTASSGTMGKEVWKTNGISNPTVVTNVLTPGANVGSDPRNLINVGGNLILSINNVTNGNQVWKFTPANNTLTRLTNMQQLGMPGTDVSEIANLNGTVFIATHSGNSVQGFQLRKLNSAAADGTTLLANSANTSKLTVVGTNLFFAQTPNHVDAPKLSTVTANGQIVAVQNFPLIPNGEYPVPQNLVNVNGTLFFTAARINEGRELWKATAASATLIQDFVGGSVSANISDLCVRGTEVFFASDGLGGNELRSSNGALNAIVTIRNIGRAGSFPKEFVKMGNFTFFSADDGSTGRELWKTDVTTNTTTRVADIIPGSTGSNPEKLIVVTASNGNQTLFFVAKDPSEGRELFKLENTVGAVPTRISNIVANGGNSPIANLTNLNGVLHFTCANQVAGINNIFKTNATRTAVQTVGGSLALADNLVVVNGNLFFTQSPQLGGPQLWKLGAAAPIKTFAMVAGGETPMPQQLTVIGNRLFFTAADGQISRRVWVMNTAGTSVSQVSSHNATDLTNFNGRLVFTAASANIAGQRSIFRVNTAFNGVEMLATGSSIGYLRAAGNTLFFFQAFHQGVIELSKITTASNNIVSLSTFPEGNSGILPQMMVAGNNLFFTMTVAASGNELWKSNGTTTSLVADIRPGVGNSNIHALAVCGTDLFFSANNLTNGQEPWKLANATAFDDGGVDEREAISEEVVEPASFTAEIKVYPNPTVDFVMVDLTAETDGVLSLLSASGQTVRSVQTMQADNSIQMDVQDLPKGIYLVRWVGADEQVIMKKLLVQ